MLLLNSLIALLGLIWVGFPLSNAGQPLLCSSDCVDILLASSRGQSLMVIGFLGYILMSTIALVAYSTRDKNTLKALFGLSSFSSILGVGLLSYQWGVEQLFCTYCFVTHLFSIGLAVSSFYTLKKTELKETLSGTLLINSLCGFGLILLMIGISLISLIQQPQIQVTEEIGNLNGEQLQLSDLDKKIGLKIDENKQAMHLLRQQQLEKEILMAEAKANKQSYLELLTDIFNTLPLSNQEVNAISRHEDKTELLSAAIDRAYFYGNNPEYFTYINQKIAEHNLQLPEPNYQSIKIPKNSKGSGTKGSKFAKISIVEFSDLDCPACRYVHNDLKAFIDKHPDEIQLTFRHFPLSMHPNAETKARASYCADKQDKFWPFVDYLFENQKTIGKSDLSSAAKEVGLNVPRFQLCLESTASFEAVQEDKLLGKSLGLQSTPTFFINGKLIKGYPGLGYFKNLLN